MNQKTYNILRFSFIKIIPNTGPILKSFYDRLLGENPSLRPLFANTDMEAQRQKLVNSLVLVVQNVDRLETIETAIKELGQRHIGYGAKFMHDPIVAATLLEALREGSGEDWDDDWEAAWKEAIDLVCETMKVGTTEQYKEMSAASAIL